MRTCPFSAISILAPWAARSDLGPLNEAIREASVQAFSNGILEDTTPRKNWGNARFTIATNPFPTNAPPTASAGVATAMETTDRVDTQAEYTIGARGQQRTIEHDHLGVVG
jgi:hypothetical protein